MKTKYEYLLHVWGGFWNKHNIAVHGDPDVPYRWFDTKEARDAEIARLEALNKTLNSFDAVIAHAKSEGYLTRFQQVLVTHVLISGELQIIENNLGFGFYSDAELKEENENIQYMKDWKWGISADIPDEAEVEVLFTTLILRLPK